VKGSWGGGGGGGGCGREEYASDVCEGSQGTCRSSDDLVSGGKVPLSCLVTKTGEVLPSLDFLPGMGALSR